jgi:hypothetical protein
MSNPEAIKNRGCKEKGNDCGKDWKIMHFSPLFMFYPGFSDLMVSMLECFVRIKDCDDDQVGKSIHLAD